MKTYPEPKIINGRKIYPEKLPTEQELREAIAQTDYNYFGIYELTEQQHEAVSALVQWALKDLQSEKE